MDDDVDVYLTRCVLAVAQMQEDGASADALSAFMYATGIALMGTWKENTSTPIPAIMQNALDALHLRARAMVDDGFDLYRYSTQMIAEMHVAVLAALEEDG